VPDTTSSKSGSRRTTVIASGLLCGLLALVVIYTKPSAFHSPIAVMVVAAIGSAAVLLQLRLYNRQETQQVRSPVWLNIVGILLAVVALFSDVLRMTPAAAQITALAAIGAFSISSALVLHAFRKRRFPPKDSGASK
jgi:uncharacterized membrane protein